MEEPFPIRVFRVIHGQFLERTVNACSSGLSNRACRLSTNY
ncbi:MAG: hypothetical protein RL514_2738 [Verrucomicrobiota bacterium]|jgi:hypothetical protein